MTKKTIFSIVIPTFNEEKNLPRLLESLIRQTEKRFEVIVVDAGSFDNTAKVTKQYEQLLPIKFIFARKKNVGFQRNLGALKAKSDWLIFCDADISFTNTFLGEISFRLDATRADFATTRGIPDSKSIIDKSLTSVIQSFMFLASFTKKPFMSGENIIIKRSIFQKIGGFNEQVILADDHELVQRNAKEGYKGRLFWNPTHNFSFRRFQREGRFKVIKKYSKALFYLLFKGPIKTQIYEYQMGGRSD